MDLQKIEKRLVGQGFDIVHRFPLQEVASDPAFERLRRSPDVTVGLLVGNTRALWPKVNEARAADPGYYDVEDPVDNYTWWAMHSLGRVYGTGCVLAFEQDDDGRFFPFQRLAVAVGLAALAPSQLLIHPTYGPWFALRAVILARGETPPRSPPVALPCACADHRCVAKFDHAMNHPDDWRAWLAVRDACPIGRAFRYSDDQIAYHYTKDRQYLPVVG